MNTLSRITLFSLLSISLSHAMEEKDITPTKKGKHKQMRDTEAEFYKDATHLLLQETFHVLENGSIPEYQEDTKRIRFHDIKESLRPKSDIPSEEDAQEIVLKRINKYFDRMIVKDTKTQKEQQKKKAEGEKIKKEYLPHHFFNNAIQNGLNITTQVSLLPEELKSALDKEEKEQECIFNKKIRTNEFRAYVAVNNLRLLPEYPYFHLHSFNDEMIRLIQSRIAEVSNQKVAKMYFVVADENKELNQKLAQKEKDLNDGATRMNNIYQDYLNEKSSKSKWIWRGLPTSYIAGGTTVVAIGVYAARRGIITVNVPSLSFLNKNS